MSYVFLNAEAKVCREVMLTKVRPGMLAVINAFLYQWQLLSEPEQPVIRVQREVRICATSNELE